MKIGLILLCFVVRLFSQEIDDLRGVDQSPTCDWKCLKDECLVNETCVRVGTKSECVNEHIFEKICKGCYILDEGHNLQNDIFHCNITLANCLVSCRVKHYKMAYFSKWPEVQCYCLEDYPPGNNVPCTNDSKDGELFFTCFKYPVGVVCKRDCFCEKEKCCNHKDYDHFIDEGCWYNSQYVTGITNRRHLVTAILASSISTAFVIVVVTVAFYVFRKQTKTEEDDESKEGQQNVSILKA